MRTREESLKIISDAIGGNAFAVNDISRNEQDTASQQNTGMKSREESLRIIQSALGGGNTQTQSAVVPPSVSSDDSSPQGGASAAATPQSAAPTAPLTQGSLVGEGRSAEQVQQEIADSRKELARLQSDAAYVLTAEPGAELGRQMDEVRARIKALNTELDALKTPNTNAERDSLIQRMNAITANEGYATTVEQADAVQQEKQETRQRLHQLDEELGNDARFYDSGERAPAVVKGAVKQTGSAYTNFMGTLQGAGNRLHESSSTADQAVAGSDYAGWATDELTAANMAQAIMKENPDGNYLEGLQKEEQRLYEKADTMADSAAKDIEQAKLGLSTLGKAGVDISVNLIQTGIDAAGRAAGLGMIPFFVRAAGGAMQEARQAGASTGQQLAYGLTKAAIEVGTEKLFDGLAGVFGKGAADDVIEGLIGKLSNSDTGRTLLRAFAGAAGEGTEEVISDLLDPFAKLIYNDQALKEAWENRAELRGQMLYDYLIGAALGGFGSVASIATGQNAEKNAKLAGVGTQEQTAEVQTGQEQTAEAIPQSATADSSPYTGEPTTPQSAVPTAPLAEEPLRAATQGSPYSQPGQESQAQAAETADRFPKAELYNMRAGKNGWDKTYGTAQEALGEAVQYVDAELWNAIGKEIDNAEGNKQGFTPMTSAMIAVQEEVRQEQITPMQGAQLLSEIYQQGGSEALKTIYNPRTGNLYDKYIGQAKQYVFQKAAETAHDAQESEAGAETPPATQNAAQTAYGELNTQAETNTQGQTENAEADAQFNELAERYGAIPTGETPARDVHVPQRISADEAVGRTARTIMEAAATPDNRLGSVREAVVDGKFSYTEISNQELADNAAQRIESDGWQKSLTDWTAAVRQNQANENLAAMGAQLLNNAGNSDMSAEQYIDLATDYNRLMHNMGRGLAAARILKTLSPEGKLYGILRSVQSMVDEANGKYNVEIDQALIDEYRSQTTDEGRDAVISKMQQNIADQIPSTWMDKFTALRYTNMLGNFKTQARNISGNILMTLGRTVKDKLAAVIESAASAASGGQVERTKSLWAGTPLYGEAMRDFTNVEREAMGESKYSDSGRAFDREVQEKRTIFKNNGKWGTDEAKTGIGRSAAAKGARKVSDLGMAGMEAYRKATNWAMEQGDRIFVRINYADALAGWLKAHNIDAEQWRSLVNEERKSDVGSVTAANRKTPLTAGTVVKALDRGNYGYVQGFDGSSYSVRFVAKTGAEATVKLYPEMVVPTNAKTVEEARSGETKGTSIVSRARQYAIQQAQEATFRDTNSVSQFVSTFDKGWGKTGFGRGAQKVMQGIAPFRKTPANVAVRAEEYSPLGILNTAYKAFEAKQGKNDVTWSDVIDSAAKTLTGSGIYFLGYLMAAAGSARGKEEDEKKAAFENMQGLQDYSIILPNGKSMSMDWVAPYSIPFFMGVLTQEAASDGGLSWDDAGKILGAVSDPMLEMSMLSGLNDALDNISKYNGDADALPQFLMNAFASYLSQGLTNSLLGQAEQASQENRQTTYTYSTLKIPTSLQYILGKASAKTPGVDYNQQDYIDAWGRKQSTGTVGERIINNFINPAYVNEDRSTPVDDELQRLYDSGQTNVLPQKATRSTKVNGERLSPDEYEAYSITKGQKSLELVQDFIESDAYKDMSDEARAEIISDLYSIAASRAAKEIANGRGESYTSDWDAEAELSDVVGYLTSKSQIQTAQGSKDYTLLDALIDTVTEQKKDVQEQLNKDFSMLDELIYGKENGVDSKTIYTAKEKADANGNGSVTQEELWNYLETQVIMPSSKKSVLWDILTSGKTGYAEYAEKHK